MTPLSQSSAATPNTESVGEAPLVVAGRALAERGYFGFIWADETLAVTARFGRLVDFVPIGEPITDGLPALIGLEDDIGKLRHDEHASLELPAVAIVSPDGGTPRLNLLLTWLSEQDALLCLAMRAGIGSDFEVELSREIRRRLIAEAQVLETSRQLERANQDLEHYASIISHDLQAPMRALRYQIDDLQTRLETQDHSFADEMSAHLEGMRRQSLRMGRMLSALLDYSSVGRKRDAICEVDTGALVTAIVASLDESPLHDIRILGTWPRLDTLEQPLDLVLRNLIDNAVKHSAGRVALVEAKADDVGDAVAFEIQDNGPGVASEYRQAIFLPFRALANNDGDEGRGMGLAIVHRIVTGIGGRIDVSDRPDGKTGAVFRVLWPKVIAD